MHALANYGPVAISVDAGEWSEYHSGIFNVFNSVMDIDHAVVCVGYGSDSTGDYWIVRNSWSTHWGEGGYIRIKRDAVT